MIKVELPFRTLLSKTWNLFAVGQVELQATTKDPGTTLRAPTAEAGLAPACKDTCLGDLRLQIWEKRSDGQKGKVCSTPNNAFVTSSIDKVVTELYPLFLIQCVKCTGFKVNHKNLRY